jgi:hypothetical protein
MLKKSSLMVTYVRKMRKTALWTSLTVIHDRQQPEPECTLTASAHPSKTPAFIIAQPANKEKVGSHASTSKFINSYHKNKKALIAQGFLFLAYDAVERTRTSTAVTPLEPESSASANSATTAYLAATKTSI